VDGCGGIAFEFLPGLGFEFGEGFLRNALDGFVAGAIDEMPVALRKDISRRGGRFSWRLHQEATGGEKVFGERGGEFEGAAIPRMGNF